MEPRDRLPRPHRFINRVDQLNRFVTIERRDRWRKFAVDRINKGAVFLGIAPLLFLGQLMHGTLDVPALESFADDQALHLARDNRRVMTKNFDALEGK